MKECASCHEWKPYEQFGNDSSRQNGKNPYCLTCARARGKAAKYRCRISKNTDLNKTGDLDCKKCGASKPPMDFRADQFSPTKRKEYCKECDNERLQYNKTHDTRICSKCWVEKPKSEYRPSKKLEGGLKSECIECTKKIYKTSRAKNRDKYLEKQRKYSVGYRERTKDKRRAYYRDRYHNDPLFRMRVSVARSINMQVKCGNSKTEDVVGCNFDTLYYHLEKTFVENYGILPDWDDFETHIDHIVPVSSATTEEEVIELNHFTNLQLLLASDNLSKSNAIGWEI